MDKIITIEKADYIDAYKIHFKFDDGKENIVDFQPFILSAMHPDIKNTEIKKYLKTLHSNTEKSNGMTMNWHFLYLIYIRVRFKHYLVRSQLDKFRQDILKKVSYLDMVVPEFKGACTP